MAPGEDAMDILPPSRRAAGDRVGGGKAGPENFTQPAPYEDPTVYCLTYRTAPFEGTRKSRVLSRSIWMPRSTKTIRTGWRTS